MTQTGPFYFKSPNSDKDLYESDSLLSWVLWVLVIFYALITIFYIGVLVNSTTFRHTYIDPSLPTPGTLISDRYDVYWVSYLLSVIVTVVFPGAVLMMVLFRDVYSSNIIWLLGILILMVFHVFALFILTIAYIDCDGPCATEPGTFTWVYWLNVLFLVLHVLYLVIVGIYWSSDVPIESSIAEVEVEEDVEARVVRGQYTGGKQRNIKKRNH